MTMKARLAVMVGLAGWAYLTHRSAASPEGRGDRAVTALGDRATRVPALGSPAEHREGNRADSRHDELEMRRAVRAVERWLATLEPEDPQLLESGAENLHRIAELKMADAPERELAEAVADARADGWSWAPIAVLLLSSPGRVRQRFG